MLSLRSKGGDFLGRGVLGLGPLSVHTVSCALPCPLPSPVSPLLSFSSLSWAPTLANTLLCLSCSTGRWVTVPRLGQLTKVSLPGLIPGWLLALEAGSLRGAVVGWTSRSQSLWISLELGWKHGLSHVGTHGTPDACQSCMGVLFPAFLSHGTSGSCVGLGTPPGIRDQSRAAAGVLPPTPSAAGHTVLGSGPEKVEA